MIAHEKTVEMVQHTRQAQTPVHLPQQTVSRNCAPAEIFVIALFPQTLCAYIIRKCDPFQTWVGEQNVVCRLHRALIFASVSAALVLHSGPLRADPAVDLFGGLFGEMIRRDMQLRQQREQMEMERQAQAVLVRRLQTALQRLGYYQGNIDGDFGAGTQEAMGAYRRDRGISPTGEISEYDISLVEGEARNRPAAQQPTYAPTSGEAEEDEAPEVLYAAVTPEAAWRKLRFSEAALAQAGPYKPPEGGGWLTVASALTFQGVVEAALAYAQDFPSSAIIKSNNGRFAITIGWMTKAQGKPLLESLKSQGILPSDAFISSGARYVGPIWTTETALKTRTELLRHGFFRAAPHVWQRLMRDTPSYSEFRARVFGINTDGKTTGYLSLRKAGAVTAEEIARMPEGTILRVRETKDGWSRVSLLDGREGWASAKYLALTESVLEGTATPAPADATIETRYGDKDLQDRLISDAEILIADVGLFLKTNSGVTGLTAIAEVVSRLNTAMAARDFPNIEAATTNLRQLLSQNAAFKLFEERRAQERAQDEQKARAAAIKLADKNIYFLTQHISQNVTAANIGTLGGLLKELEAAIRFPTRAALDDLNARVSAVVQRDGLAGSYEQSVQGYVPPMPNPPEQSGETAPGTTSNAAAAPDDSAQAQAELRKLADEAQTLIDQVNRFGASGQRVADVGQAARLIVNLKAALRSADGAQIVKDQKALAALLAQDAAFSTFKAQEDEAARLSEARKTEAATHEAKRIMAFAEAYISRNFASDKIETLLTVQDDLTASLKGGDAPSLFATIDRAQEQIAKAELKPDLDAFKLASPTDESSALITCRSTINLSQWQEAQAACANALAEQPGNAELLALRQRVDAAIEAQQQAADDDRKRAAEREAAKTSAAYLLTQLKAFADEGKELSDPLRTARLAEVLRGVLDGADALRITAARDALRAALAEDKAFTAYVSALEQGQQTLALEVLSTEDAEARRLRAFITLFVSRNITAAGIGPLLNADDALAKALDAKNGTELLAANEAARQAIAEMGATAELDAFQLQTSPSEETKACLARVAEAAWDEARAACATATARDPKNGAAAAALARTEQELAQRAQRETDQSLTIARKQAEKLLTQIDAFTKTDQTFSDPLKMARLVAALRTSLAQQDGGAVMGATTALQEALQAEASYITFAQQAAQEQQRTALDSLAEVKAENRRIKAFVETHVARHIASPDVPKLLDLVTALDRSVTAETASGVADTNAEAIATLAELKLSDTLAAFSLAPKNAELAPASTSNEIFLDEKNRLLLEGDGNDILVLFNASGQARGVRRDLLSRVVFAESTTLCWYHDVPPLDIGTQLVFSDILTRGAKTLTVTGVCSADGLVGGDLVAVRRSALLATDRAYAKGLVDAFAAGAYQSITTVTERAISERKAANAKLANQIRTDLTQGNRAGYGVILFAPEKPTLCLVAGPHAGALAESLALQFHPLAGSLPDWATRTVSSADEGFAATRQGVCGGLLLEASDLAKVLHAAEREAVSQQILPLWFDATAMNEIQARLNRDTANRAEAEATRKRRLADEATEDRLRREALGEEKARKEAELRDQYQSLAEGLATNVGDQIRSFLAAPSAPDTATILEMFPTFARWYRDEVNGGWELQSDGYDSALVDYGTVRWQGRALDTVFVKTAVGMKHRDLGKYQVTCMLLGVVVDQEFGRYRDVFEKPCDAAEPLLGTWKSAHGFESRWILKQ
jgi:peptidoglycan hydrolase-like protein with peptidoglycan-binding domain